MQAAGSCCPWRGQREVWRDPQGSFRRFRIRLSPMGAADENDGASGAQADANFEMNGIAGDQVAAGGADSAAEIENGNCDAEIFGEIRGDGVNGVVQARAGIAALANAMRGRVALKGLQGESRGVDTALGHEILHPAGIDFFEGLKRDNAKFAGMLPAK